MFSEESSMNAVEAQLVSVLGAVVGRSAVTPFTHSDYYRTEMGSALMRSFLLFGSLTSREQLPEVKLETNEIEQQQARDDRRTVNIDPGYIALEHVVLATTKGYAHRLYLGRGIYGDLTLMFEHGGYRALPWTYPDYRSNEIISLFTAWRDQYKERLRCRKV